MIKKIIGACKVAVFVLIIVLGFGISETASANSFYYTFNSSGTLFEAGSLSLSSSPYWWVNSGAFLVLSGTVGSTAQGSLPTLSPWRILYAANNSADTDNGFHPQNIFRLVTKSKWNNVREQGIFRVKADNLSNSPNRNSSNGILFFVRYQDSDTLYYTGIRVDGSAVVKKKINGTYYILASKQIIPGTYNHSSKPNLIPKNTWIGLRTETVTNSNGTVGIKLYTDIGNTGTWTLAVSALDDNKSYGGKAITASGYAGIRTDFMDVEFDNFKLENL